MDNEYKKWLKAMCKDNWQEAERYARIIANYPKGSERMYIPEFWCGVISTLLVEVVVLIGIAIYYKERK